MLLGGAAQRRVCLPTRRLAAPAAGPSGCGLPPALLRAGALAPARARWAGARLRLRSPHRWAPIDPEGRPTSRVKVARPRANFAASRSGERAGGQAAAARCQNIKERSLRRPSSKARQHGHGSPQKTGQGGPVAAAAAAARLAAAERAAGASKICAQNPADFTATSPALAPACEHSPSALLQARVRGAWRCARAGNNPGLISRAAPALRSAAFELGNCLLSGERPSPSSPGRPLSLPPAAEHQCKGLDSFFTAPPPPPPPPPRPPARKHRSPVGARFTVQLAVIRRLLAA